MLFITDKESYMQNGVICVGRYLLGYYFRWKHVTALACFIHLHSLKLQTPAVSVGSLVYGNDFFVCRNTNFVLKVLSPVCTAKNLRRVNLQQTRPFYKAYEYQGPRFLLL